MATTGNALSASFGLDLQPLKRDFAQAEQIGRQGAAKVQSAIARANSVPINWGALSRQREQAAAFFGGQGPRTARSFLPAPRGKYPSPSEQMGEEAGSSRIRGLGAGLTAFAAVHQFVSLYSRLNDDAAALNAKIANLTRLTGSGSFRGMADLEDNVKGAVAALDQLRTRDALEQQGKERTPQMTLGHIVRRGRQMLTGDSDENEERQKEALRKQVAKSLDAMAAKQEDLNKAEDEGRTGSERSSEMMKAEIQHRERLGKLAEMEAAGNVHDPAARNAEVNRYRSEVDAIGRKFDLSKQQQVVEGQILALHETSLSQDNQSIVALQKRITLLKQQLALPGTKEQKAAISNQITGLQNQMSSAQYNESRKPWAQRAQEMNDQRDYQNWVRNQSPSVPGAYKSHPDAYNRRDILGNKVDENGNVVGPGGSGPDKQGVGLLGSPGVLDRIEKAVQGIGANK